MYCNCLQVIKQSHMILKFLAVEGRVTSEHVELVWAAAQLKHCGRQVYDLLPGFIRALAPKPCSHLYSLLCSLPPKEHTEQVTIPYSLDFFKVFIEI